MKIPKPEWTPICADVNWVAYSGSWLVDVWADHLMWAIDFDVFADDEETITNCVSVVLMDRNSESVETALACCGWELDVEENIVDAHSGEVVVCIGEEDRPPREWFAVLANALLAHGTFADLWTTSRSYDYDDNDRQEEEAEEMVDEAYTQLLHLQADRARLRETLEAPANPLGATWRDMMNGDPMAPLRQKAADIVCGKDTELMAHESLMLKVFSASGGQTLDGRVESDLALAGTMIRADEEQQKEEEDG
jgi:hypothetical protein